MVDSVGDYLYVTGADIDATHPHGDMDRIVIDGDVMPLRTGNIPGLKDKDDNPIPRKNILRGEDVCFLAEAYFERDTSCIMTSGIPGSFQFRRKLGRNALNNLVISWHNALGAHPHWVPPGSARPLSAAYVEAWPGTFHNLSAYFPAAYSWPNGPIAGSTDWIAVAYEQSPYQLHCSTIEAMFKNLKLMTAAFLPFTTNIISASGDTLVRSNVMPGTEAVPILGFIASDQVGDTSVTGYFACAARTVGAGGTVSVTAADVQAARDFAAANGGDRNFALMSPDSTHSWACSLYLELGDHTKWW